MLVGTLYETCNIAVAAGAGGISAKDPFLLLLDGGTNYDSYFTFAGATFSPGASIPPVVTPPGTISEPTSLALLASGLAGLGFLRRRKNK